MSYGFYTLTHKHTGHFYIGSSQNTVRRLKTHKIDLERGAHSNRLLQQAFTAWKDFDICVTATIDLESARAGEQRLLNTYVGKRLCCNISTSSTNGLAGVRGIVSVETRIKNLEKATAARRGSVLTDEHKAKIGLANTGKLISENHRARIAESSTNRDVSIETRLKISAGNRGKVRSDEYKQNISRMKSKRVSISGKVYPSLKVCAIALTISDVTLRKRLNDNINYPDWVYV